MIIDKNKRYEILNEIKQLVKEFMKSLKNLYSAGFIVSKKLGGNITKFFDELLLNYI